MPACRYTLLDVFTRTPLEGNQLAVVHDADALDAATMGRFARETRLSETTFVQAATEAGADYRNRIWSLRGELPFAGHPSLGTAVAVARLRGEREADYVQQTLAGLQPVRVSVEDDRRARASMLQQPASFGAELDPAVALGAVGLDAVDAASGLPAQVVCTGVPHLLVPVGHVSTLARARPRLVELDALLEPLGAVVLYLVAVDWAGETARARSFLAGGEPPEDPATGSAAGPLCAYLAARGRGDRVTVTQGVEMSRPSRIDCRLEGDRVRVSGDVVALVDGTLTL